MGQGAGLDDEKQGRESTEKYLILSVSFAIPFTCHLLLGLMPYSPETPTFTLFNCDANVLREALLLLPTAALPLPLVLVWVAFLYCS